MRIYYEDVTGVIPLPVVVQVCAVLVLAAVDVVFIEDLVDFYVCQLKFNELRYIQVFVI